MGGVAAILIARRSIRSKDWGSTIVGPFGHRLGHTHQIPRHLAIHRRIADPGIPLQNYQRGMPPHGLIESPNRIP